MFKKYPFKRHVFLKKLPVFDKNKKNKLQHLTIKRTSVFT